MSTDLYGVRVVELDPAECRVRFRVFVVHYRTSFKSHVPLPDDASFFLRVLGDVARFGSTGKTALGAVVTAEQWLDENWVDANACQVVERFERLATRNYPVTDEEYDELADVYYERAGGWSDEDRLVQADYDVWVTDVHALEGSTLGASWGTTNYLTRADRLRSTDLPFVPSLRAAVAVHIPFTAYAPHVLAFSDDGRYLAAASDEGELVVYGTDGWTEQVRVDRGRAGSDALLGWLPGRSVVQLWQPGKPDNSWAFDVDAGREVEAVVETGGRYGTSHARSRTGQFRVDYGDRPGVQVLADDGLLRCVWAGEAGPVSVVAFTADETRMFAAGGGPDVFVLELPSGRVIDTIAAPDIVRSVAAHPNGRYLAVTHGFAHSAEIQVLRVADREIISRHQVALFAAHLVWSPDGRWLAADVFHHPSKCIGAELHVYPVGRTALHMRPMPAADRAGDSTESTIDHALLRTLATAPPSTDEIEQLRAAHERWLSSGAGLGDGEQHTVNPTSPWQVLTAAGLAHAVYTGPAGRDGQQAVLRLRQLGGDLRGLTLPWADLTAVTSTGNWT